MVKHSNSNMCQPKASRTTLLMWVVTLSLRLPLVLAQSQLMITGIIDGPLSGGTPKAIELVALGDIADLSTYGVGSATNGGGTDGVEFTFPNLAVVRGSFIYVSFETDQFAAFFGFTPALFFTDSDANNNGDDAIELFFNGNVVDVFGEIDMDGTGRPWDHVDGWAYRMSGGPVGIFDVMEWTFSGTNALDNEETNNGASIPFPIGTFTLPSSSMPSGEPSALPSTIPSTSTIPSACPSTSSMPSSEPSAIPSGESAAPSSMPSIEPSATPSSIPSIEPSATPSTIPSSASVDEATSVSLVTGVTALAVATAAVILAAFVLKT